MLENKNILMTRKFKRAKIFINKLQGIHHENTAGTGTTVGTGTISRD